MRNTKNTKNLLKQQKKTMYYMLMIHIGAYNKNTWIGDYLKKKKDIITHIIHEYRPRDHDKSRKKELYMNIIDRIFTDKCIEKYENLAKECSSEDFLIIMVTSHGRYVNDLTRHKSVVQFSNRRFLMYSHTLVKGVIRKLFPVRTPDVLIINICKALNPIVVNMIKEMWSSKEYDSRWCLIAAEGFMSYSVFEHIIEVLEGDDRYGIYTTDKQFRVIYATILINVWVVIAQKLQERWKTSPEERERKEWLIGERQACDLWATIEVPIHCIAFFDQMWAGMTEERSISLLKNLLRPEFKYLTQIYVTDNRYGAYISAEIKEFYNHILIILPKPISMDTTMTSKSKSETIVIDPEGTAMEVEQPKKENNDTLKEAADSGLKPEEIDPLHDESLIDSAFYSFMRAYYGAGKGTTCPEELLEVCEAFKLKIKKDLQVWTEIFTNLVICDREVRNCDLLFRNARTGVRMVTNGEIGVRPELLNNRVRNKYSNKYISEKLDTLKNRQEVSIPAQVSAFWGKIKENLISRDSKDIEDIEEVKYDSKSHKTSYRTKRDFKVSEEEEEEEDENIGVDEEGVGMVIDSGDSNRISAYKKRKDEIDEIASIDAIRMWKVKGYYKGKEMSSDNRMPERMYLFAVVTDVNHAQWYMPFQCLPIEMVMKKEVISELSGLKIVRMKEDEPALTRQMKTYKFPKREWIRWVDNSAAAYSLIETLRNKEASREEIEMKKENLRKLMAMYTSEVTMYFRKFWIISANKIGTNVIPTKIGGMEHVIDRG